MAMIIADTDVLIEYLRGRGTGVQVEEKIRAGTLSTTVISAFELWVGCHTKKERDAVEGLLAALVILELDTSSARIGAGIHRNLLKSGEGIGMADSLIAGVCLVRKGILFTNNKKHYKRVDSLVLL